MNRDDISIYEFELTSRCNAACPGCTRTEILQGKHPRAFDAADLDFSKIKEEFKEVEPNTITIKLAGSLGDPAMHPECLEICEYLVNCNYRIKIHTNGGNRDETFWHNLGVLAKKHNERNPNFFRVVFAIDGLEDTNSTYRVGVNWKQLMKNVKAYTAQTHASWHFIPFDYCEHQIDEAKELANSLNLSFVLRKSLRNSFNVWENAKKVSIPSHKQHHESVEKSKNTKEVLKEYKIKKITDEGDDLSSALNNLGKTINCAYFHQKRIYIDSHCKVWPCCNLSDDYYKGIVSNKLIFPDNENWNNLSDHSIKKIIDSDFYQNLDSIWNYRNQNFSSRCLRDCSNNGEFQVHLEEV